MKEENKIQNIDHVSVYVRDFALSKTFYTNVLATIGYKNLYENKDDRFVGFGITRPVFWIVESKETLHPSHVALSADSKSVVESFYETALLNKAKDNGRPGYRDIYGVGYYASFILDEDGNNIEVVYREDIDKENIFDVWNNCKKNTEANGRPNIKEGEIWWCRIGKNIGVEQDGKNENFRRPVLVVKKYSNEIVFVVPLSSQNKVSNWYYKFSFKEKTQVAVLNQAKPVDVKRFDQLMGTVADNTLINIRKAFIDLFGG